MPQPRIVVRALVGAGTLSEGHISDALAMRDAEFVYHALGAMGQTSIEQIKHIFEMKAPKPIVALAWHAGLSMRVALELQKELGQVQPKELLYPKEGSDYPMSEDELNWQLEFLGLKAA